MKFSICQKQKGFTLAEMLIGFAVGMICMGVLMSIIWTGSRLVSRNMSVNLAHFNTVIPMQQLSDDVHAAVLIPTLTGALTAASGVVPPGFTGGGTKNWSGGKMTNWTFTTVTTGTTPTVGLSLFLPASTQYTSGSTALAASGSYRASGASFVVSGSTYAASSNTISIELRTNDESTLLQNSVNGMYLFIPSKSVNNIAVLRKISSATVSGAVSGTTLLAKCTLSGTLGVSITSGGTRSNSSNPLVQAYLLAPVNYFVCGTDLVRLNYDGSWQIIMRNLVPAPPAAATDPIKPFSVPWPPSVSYLSTTPDGRRAVNVSLAATNADYSNNTKFRGTGSNMQFSNILIWNRMQKFNAYNGTSTVDIRDELSR